MANVFDVAKYILAQRGPMSAMKLQKLVYYSQAWSLVWDDAPLFDSKIEAWANGPVVRSLYYKHQGQFTVSVADFASANGELTDDQKETIDTVLLSYGDRSAQWLSDQTHSEAPWLNARAGLAESDRSDKEISLASMAEFYSTL